MMAATAAGAPPARDVKWDAIDWRLVHNRVRRLQVRIAKAAGEKPYTTSSNRVASATFVSA